MVKTIFYHVDIDSPATLLRFWDIPDAQMDLEQFYNRAISRALDLFREEGVFATFFCVGRELDMVSEAAKGIRRAFDSGHEIANHTYTHPYGLSRMDHSSILHEIRSCSDAIERVIGVRPAGFRSPSYDLSGPILDVLEELSFAYDSSAYWNSLMSIMKFYYRTFSRIKSTGEFGHGTSQISFDPYRPSLEDWSVVGFTDPRNILEIPLTRSSTFQLPFYNNFHLSVGARYRDLSTKLMKRNVVVYLIHLIEFVDKNDGLPAELSVHPNVKRASSMKIEFLRQTIRLLSRRYQCERSDRFAAQMMKAYKK